MVHTQTIELKLNSHVLNYSEALNWPFRKETIHIIVCLILRMHYIQACKHLNFMKRKRTEKMKVVEKAKRASKKTDKACTT